jgi:SAM-dependent methyltransferase
VKGLRRGARKVARNMAAPDRRDRLWTVCKAWIGFKPKLTDEPRLVPPLRLMQSEGIDEIEWWFRWADEWAVILRAFGGVGSTSDVLEVGCGLGRIAFPLRHVLVDGTYTGFDISKTKIDFLNRTFRPAHPNFTFDWADLHNTDYNPDGAFSPETFVFPYEDESFDTVFAASVWTHLLPQYAAHYFDEIARVLRPSGTVFISAFLLDNFEPRRTRPPAFADPRFDLVHAFGDHGNDFAVSSVKNPELVTGYRMSFLEELANTAGLVLDRPALAGMWSGISPTWVIAQDLLVFGRSD